MCFAVKLCLILLAIVYTCSVWFGTDDSDFVRVFIRPLWLQRLCRFLLVVVGILLLVLDAIFVKEFVTLDENGLINVARILGGFCVMGAVFFLIVLGYIELIGLIAFILKELAKYVWSE